MREIAVYELLAAAFAAEGTEAHFTLLGDGNMHWSAALSHLPNVRTFYVRHEHCACGMAIGYSYVSGKIGVASVTHGPGFTQVMTALTTAVRARVPMVLLAGETPLRKPFHVQHIEQAPLAVACGARYISAHAPERLLDYVREAFYYARVERRPVVLGIPSDLLLDKVVDNRPYVPSNTLLPALGSMSPDPGKLAELVDKVLAARSIVLLAGRGAALAGAGPTIERLGERCGATYATTLPARGMFDHNPFSLSIAGGFSREICLEVCRDSDLVIAVGASLSIHTVYGGKLFPKACLVQIDTEPRGFNHGRMAANLYIRGDAKLTVETLDTALAARGFTSPGVRSPELARRIAKEPSDRMKFDIAPGTLDPRDATSDLDRLLPKDWDLVCGNGHATGFNTQMRGRMPGRFHAIREFGAIGNGISIAMGVAAARPDSQVVLLDGDGSLLMHIQELETIRRHGMKLLIGVFNDGAFGSEIHVLRSEGIDDSGAIFGRGDLASVARAFGLRGVTINRRDQFETALAEFQAGDAAMIWDIHIADNVVAPDVRSHHPPRGADQPSKAQ